MTGVLRVSRLVLAGLLGVVVMGAGLPLALASAAANAAALSLVAVLYHPAEQVSGATKAPHTQISALAQVKGRGGQSFIWIGDAIHVPNPKESIGKGIGGHIYTIDSSGQQRTFNVGGTPGAIHYISATNKVYVVTYDDPSTGADGVNPDSQIATAGTAKPPPQDYQARATPGPGNIPSGGQATPTGTVLPSQLLAPTVPLVATPTALPDPCGGRGDVNGACVTPGDTYVFDADAPEAGFVSLDPAYTHPGRDFAFVPAATAALGLDSFYYPSGFYSGISSHTEPVANPAYLGAGIAYDAVSGLVIVIHGAGSKIATANSSNPGLVVPPSIAPPATATPSRGDVTSSSPPTQPDRTGSIVTIDPKTGNEISAVNVRDTLFGGKAAPQRLALAADRTLWVIAEPLAGTAGSTSSLPDNGTEIQTVALLSLDKSGKLGTPRSLAVNGFPQDVLAIPALNHVALSLGGRLVNGHVQPLNEVTLYSGEPFASGASAPSHTPDPALLNWTLERIWTPLVVPTRLGILNNSTLFIASPDSTLSTTGPAPQATGAAPSAATAPAERGQATPVKSGTGGSPVQTAPSASGPLAGQPGQVTIPEAPGVPANSSSSPLPEPTIAVTPATASVTGTPTTGFAPVPQATPEGGTTAVEPANASPATVIGGPIPYQRPPSSLDILSGFGPFVLLLGFLLVVAVESFLFLQNKQRRLQATRQASAASIASLPVRANPTQKLEELDIP